MADRLMSGDRDFSSGRGNLVRFLVGVTVP
jgi:hypothetical protein